MSKREKAKVESKPFEYKDVANFSDDVLGVLGWKGSILLLVLVLLGFGLVKVFL